MGNTMDSETEIKVITALVGFVRSQTKAHLIMGTNVEDFAQEIIEIIARECSDDSGMDLAEQIVWEDN